MGIGEMVNIARQQVRGRSKRRFMDVVKEDMKFVGVRGCRGYRWRRMICCGDP